MDEFDIVAYCQNVGNETVVADCYLYKTISQSFDGLSQGINVFFLLSFGALLFGRQAGFAMINAGMVRELNVNNTLIKSLLDACTGSVAFWAIGYAFAFGGEDPARKSFIGNQNFFLRDFRDGYNQLILFYFQASFAQNSATVVTGVLAGRSKMGSHFFYSTFITAFVYPVIVHNVWSKSGYLSPFNNTPFRGVGAIDFGGSGVVHVTGGVAALIGACILGPRKGRFYDANGEPLLKPAHTYMYSPSFVVLGVFLLWVGWLAYNPGSETYTTTPQLATGIALAGTNTFLAACAGSLSALLLDTFIEMRRTGFVTYDFVMACNGALVGLVSISGCCALVPSWVSVVIGVVGGWVYYAGAKLLLHLRIDDAVDAIPAHLGGGIWGLLATGLFSNPRYMQAAGYNGAHPGWFYSWAGGSSDANLLLCEFCLFLYICTWVTVMMGPTFWILRRIGEFRVDEDDELRGLDRSFHGIMQELPSSRRLYGSNQFSSSQFGSGQFRLSSQGFHQHDDKESFVQDEENVQLNEGLPKPPDDMKVDAATESVKKVNVVSVQESAAADEVEGFHPHDDMEGFVQDEENVALIEDSPKPPGNIKDAFTESVHDEEMIALNEDLPQPPDDMKADASAESVEKVDLLSLPEPMETAKVEAVAEKGSSEHPLEPMQDETTAAEPPKV